tara:strand:- start:95 stop:490 length:396 start_codon:yes stop_codon:yes gene_type:complete
MKETYIKIYNQAQQKVGLAAPGPEEAEALNMTGDMIAQEASAMLGMPDGNENAPTYVPPAGNILGYACSTFAHGPGEGHFGEMMEEGGGEADPNDYQANAWRYPIDAENNNFIFADPSNKTFAPCGGMSMA